MFFLNATAVLKTIENLGVSYVKQSEQYAKKLENESKILNFPYRSDIVSIYSIKYIPNITKESVVKKKLIKTCLLRMSKRTEKLQVDQVNMRNEGKTISPTSSSDSPTAKRKSAILLELLLSVKKKTLKTRLTSFFSKGGSAAMVHTTGS